MDNTMGLRFIVDSTASPAKLTENNLTILLCILCGFVPLRLKNLANLRRLFR
jgi:hypothetical protein